MKKWSLSEKILVVIFGWYEVNVKMLREELLCVQFVVTDSELMVG